MLPICTMFSMRVSASRVVLAWMVDIEPSWPVFIACSMSNASPPRTSPMMMRSGRMRSALRTRSRWVISPRPSRLAGRVSRRTTCGCCNCSSAASSTVTTRSPAIDQPRHRVHQRRLAGAGAARDDHVQPCLRGDLQHARDRQRSARRIRSAWRSRCSCLPNLRIEMYGPSSASGGNTMLTREPSFSRASTIGLDSSIRRPTAGGDALADVGQMRGVAEPDVGQHHLAAALDERPVRPVHHDVGDACRPRAAARADRGRGCRAPVRRPARAARAR